MSIQESIKKIDKIRINEAGQEVYPLGHPMGGQIVPVNERQLTGAGMPPKSWAEIMREQTAEYDDETMAALEVLKKKGLA